MKIYTYHFGLLMNKQGNLLDLLSLYVAYFPQLSRSSAAYATACCIGLYFLIGKQDAT